MTAGFRLALILGGAKSGKSRYGLSLAARFPEPRLFVATCEPGDAEMCARIEDHQKERGPDWETREVPLDLAGVLGGMQGGHGVILIDCLTMWLANLMAKESGQESGVQAELDRLVQALARPSAPTILISNEVGSGIVPENALAREFRDRAGLLHQRLAREADLVVLVVAGIPLVVKVGEPFGGEGPY
jgi:adenosylcobinamide kinase/adenosylcobinamide-phosphate guanylyltransferase